MVSNGALIIKNISSAFKKKLFFVQIKLNKNSFGQKMFQKKCLFGEIVRFFLSFPVFLFNFWR